MFSTHYNLARAYYVAQTNEEMKLDSISTKLLGLMKDECSIDAMAQDELANDRYDENGRCVHSAKYERLQRVLKEIAQQEAQLEYDKKKAEQRIKVLSQMVEGLEKLADTNVKKEATINATV